MCGCGAGWHLGCMAFADPRLNSAEHRMLTEWKTALVRHSLLRQDYLSLGHQRLCFVATDHDKSFIRCNSFKANTHVLYTTAFVCLVVPGIKYAVWLFQLSFPLGECPPTNAPGPEETSAETNDSHGDHVWDQITLLRVIPTMTFIRFVTGKSSGILNSFWNFIWHSLWHTFWHSIWHLLWQSIWHFIWHSLWHTFWHSIWHIF